MVKLLLAGALILGAAAPLAAQEYEDHNRMLMDHGAGHLMDMGGGMVMGQNTDTLPGGCDKISETKEITVHAGHKYAEKFPGRMFAFDTQEYQFKPCTKLTVHFINDDSIRHQWMMHGLPKYLYPKGMFHLEVTGPAKISGTLILPPGDKTYLVHCDIAQHMEKGMKGQLKVGAGSGDLPSIPGVTAFEVADDYTGSGVPVIAKPAQTPAALATPSSAPAATPAAPAAQQEESFVSGITVIGLAVGLLLAPVLARAYKDMTFSEGVTHTFVLLRRFIEFLLGLVARLVKMITSNKSKMLPGG
ncbi:MAG: copper oxidase [Gammaproteobacteria bacterium]